MAGAVWLAASQPQSRNILGLECGLVAHGPLSA